MGFNFNSNSNSDSKSDSFGGIKKVESEIDLQNLIKNAKTHGLKKVIVKDKRISPLRLGVSNLFGHQVSVSLLPDTQKTYEIEFL